MPYEVRWSAAAHDDLLALFDYVAEHSSAWDASQLCDTLIRATDHLADFPRLYEAAPQYGDGVRRISQSGQHVLYEIDDPAQTATILAIVSQRQQARLLK